MLTSLGFDTVLIHNRRYTDGELEQLFSLFSQYDVKNFIFLCDFDFALDSITIERQRTLDFLERAAVMAPRGVYVKAFYNVIANGGFAFNKDIKRIYANKKRRSLFVGLPLFTDNSFDVIAHDLNNLIYRQKTFPVFTGFDGVLNTASPEFCRKLIKNGNVGFGFDLNYLFDPKNAKLLFELLESRVLFLPMISHDISNYVGVIKSAEYIMEEIGKKSYYQLCSQIRKCASRFDC